jgi:hypothetical protein
MKRIHEEPQGVLRVGLSTVFGKLIVVRRCLSALARNRSLTLTRVGRGSISWLRLVPRGGRYVSGLESYLGVHDAERSLCAAEDLGLQGPRRGLGELMERRSRRATSICLALHDPVNFAAARMEHDAASYQRLSERRLDRPAAPLGPSGAAGDSTSPVRSIARCRRD